MKIKFKLINEIALQDDLSVVTIEKKWPRDFVDAYKSQISDLLMMPPGSDATTGNNTNTLAIQ